MDSTSLLALTAPDKSRKQCAVAKLRGQPHVVRLCVGKHDARRCMTVSTLGKLPDTHAARDNLSFEETMSLE